MDEQNNRDLGRRIFEAIVKSIEDPAFANQVIQNSERHGPSALNLATFEPGCTRYQCLRQYRLSELLVALRSDVSDDLYYRIRTGPFSGWCLRSKYLSKNSSRFTLEKIC
jgi:hypothetical protein